MRKNSLAIAAVSLFLIGQLWQLAVAQTPTKAAVSAAFSKAAIKALLTIDRNSNKQLVDAAMVDLEATGSTRAERSVAHEIEVFEAIHDITERMRQSDLEAAKALEAANISAGGGVSSGGGVSGEVQAHINDNHACMVAWVPKLRALSAGIPKQCKLE